MRNLILASAAALAFTATPVIAQDMDDDMDMYEWSADQETMYDGWPADRQTAYDAWPGNVQEYYWTLTPMQTEGWWVLNDEQRVRIFEMAPEQRAAAWTQIAAQMNNTAPSAATTARTTTTSSANMRFVSNEMVQPTPGDQGPPTGDLPICTANAQDNCINSWEARGTGTKPLDYWPGQPASEMD